MQKKITIKILLGLSVFTILFLLKSVSQTFDSKSSDILNKISGERNPDSSIIIIHINSEDIEQLGPWPLKRSYYALLIKNLNKLHVNKIGLEVFLSSKFATQGVYDNLLIKEINYSNNVVLSSLAGSLYESNNIFITDSLSLPSVKLLDDKILTGHINYISELGITIPLNIDYQGKVEKAFCYRLLDIGKQDQERIELNFISSWNKFTQYSLIEFFQLIQNNDPSLKRFQDKIILIGVSDPQLSSMIETTKDNKMPGVALHAFALDNLLNQRYINTSYYFLSKVLFVLLFFMIIILMSKRQNLYLIYFGVVLSAFVLSYILYRYLYIELAYSFFLFPLFALVLTDIYFNQILYRNKVEEYFNEAELFKKLLKEKEKELYSIQKKHSALSDLTSSQYLNKIKSLKENIERLKENEDDKIVAKIIAEPYEVNFQGLVYKSKLMNNVSELIQKSAPTDAAILITGESGTGKELVARAIHNLSKRNNEKFVAINCAAVTESLLESELFGHVKGSFTGAISDKIGKFELANKGTIFLDEIGETSENFQVKLLRVLQSGEYDKVGSISSYNTDVRVISATNKNPKQLVKEGKFREDLFYRINVINIHLPTLNERKEDIEPITRHYLHSNDKKYNISISALKALNEYDWRGNVRELESVLKRAIVFCDGSGRDLIHLYDLPDDLIKSIKLNFEDLVIESLRNKIFSHSSINETAKELGNVNRTLVSENFRGLAFRLLVENNYEEVKTILLLAGCEDQYILERVKSKLDTWLSNIKKDTEKLKSKDFKEVKLLLNSKYKNLPQKYHSYLDEVIKYLLR